MPYVGRNADKLSNVEVLDTITFDGSQSYILQKNSVNFTPSSANTLLISIDGVVQAGNFTVSGSTVDFGVAVASSSTCDFILHYGVGLITTPADGTITDAKLAASAINSQTAETSIAGGDEVLIYDTSASALRKMTRTNFVSGLAVDNTPSFYAQLSANQSYGTSGAVVKVQFDTELWDTDSDYDNLLTTDLHLQKLENILFMVAFILQHFLMLQCLVVQFILKKMVLTIKVLQVQILTTHQIFKQ